MTIVQSLEQERQAILDRMQMRRESYRRMLSGEEDARRLPPRAERHAETHAAHRLDVGDGAIADNTAYTYRRAPDSFPRTRLMQTVSEHPMLWALGVAAVLAIGPRRIVRSVASGSTALGAVAASQSRMDMLGRVLTLASAYAQRRRG
jgi:hypothetical protein